MKAYLIGGGLILLLLAGIGLYMQGRSDGKALTNQKYQAAELALRREITTLKSAADTATLKKQAAVKAARRQSNERIKKLLEENATLRDWWVVPVPDAARRHAYGL